MAVKERSIVNHGFLNLYYLLNQLLVSAKFRPILLLTSLLFSGMVLFSQISNPKTYTTIDGLPHNDVRDIVEDRDGFLWIATWDGLSRFDGSEFTNYYHVPGDSLSLPYFSIEQLCIDKENTLWISSHFLTRFNRETSHFIKFHQKSSPPLQFDYVPSICLNKEGELFCSGRDGVARFNYKTRQFDLCLFVDKSGIPAKIRGGIISIDEDNTLWIYPAIGQKILQCSPDTSTFSSVPTYVIQGWISYKFPKYSIGNLALHMSVHRANKGHYITSNIGLFLYPVGSSGFELFKGQSPPSWLKLTSPLIWGSVGNGFSLYDPWTGITSNFEDTYGFYLEACHLDRSGNCWFGGLTGFQEGVGLKLLRKKKNPFRYYFSTIKIENSGLVVYPILKTGKGDVWIGVTNKCSVLKQSPQGKVSFQNVLPRSLLWPGNKPRSIIEFPGNTIWIGYSDSLLMKGNDPDSKFRRCYPDMPDEISISGNSSYKVLTITHQKKLVAAGKGRIVLFDPPGLKYLASFRDTATDFYSVLCSRNNLHIWGGGTGYLYHLDTGLRLIEKIKISEGLYNIESIVETEPHTLYLGLLGGGLCKYDIRTGEEEIFSTRDHLINNTIYSILPDNHKNLWVSTNNGISMFNTETGKFINFGQEDGLSIKEFNSAGAFQCKDGELLFGGMGGVVGFYPDSLIYSSYEYNPKIIFDRLTIHGETESAVYKLWRKDKIRLPAGTTAFTLHFNCINFVAPEKNAFRYRISGFSPDWFPLSGRFRSITALGIHNGDFRIEIECMNIKGHWGKPFILSIEIPPTFFERFPLPLLIGATLIFILIMAGFFVYKMMVNRKNIQLAESKNLSLRSSSFYHFLKNSVNLIRRYVPKSEDTGREYLETLKELLHHMMRYKNVEFIPMIEEIDFLNRYTEAENIRLGNIFDFCVEYAPIDITEIKIPHTMIQPFVENSIIHGIQLFENKRGKISVTFRLAPSKERLICIVDDNGVGMKNTQTEQKQNSNGITIFRERIASFNKTRRHKLNELIYEEIFPEEENAGTRAIFELPVLFCNNHKPLRDV